MVLLRLALLCLWIANVQSVPYFILTSTRAKCQSVIAPQGQTITVTYHAPDLKLDDVAGDGVDDDRRKLNQDQIEQMKMQEEAKDQKGAEDGMDAQWNRRMTEKLEKIKNQKSNEMSITITQKAGLTGALESRQRRTSQGVSGAGRVREDVRKRAGSIEFKTGEDDGTVEICVQSVTANRNRPTRVSVKVTTVASEDDEASSEEDASASRSEGDVLEHNAVKSQMSRLERDMRTLSNRVKAINNNADFNKEQEVAFHDQSVAMNSAARYWPIIQVVVIVVTGFTQANHIVGYMRSHHIGA